MNDDTNTTTCAEEPIRVMALHALAYCPRLFYLEEVEEIRLADGAVFAGRSLHERLQKEEDDADPWKSLEMADESLGLVGKVDCLRKRDGEIIPYEHKRGRPKRDGGRTHAWPSDALQVAAYALLVEKHLGVTVKEGRIRYHAENVTVRVPIDDEARQGVLHAIEDARRLRRSTSRPPVVENDRLCLKCSLAPVCLPEEERLAGDPQWEPVRMFPPVRDRQTVHVLEPGARISRSGEQIKIVRRDEPDQALPGKGIEAVVLHGYPQITTQALHYCAYQDIAVHWLSSAGRYIGGFQAGAGGVQRRLRQYDALASGDLRTELARRLAMAKVEGALRYTLRATRGKDRETGDVDDAIRRMRRTLKSLAHSEDVDSIRGHEGLAGRAYFAALKSFFRDEVPEEMIPDGRSRRPPRDRFNALLSFGYALLYQNVLQAILTVGLEPALGFFHTPRSSAHPLVLDVMELFRATVWDVPLVGSVNRLQWDLTADFQIAGSRVWLSDQGRRKAIQLFERRLEETWKHPVVGYSLSYGRLIELEVRLLEKEWTGEGGLFAKMRIR